MFAGAPSASLLIHLLVRKAERGVQQSGRSLVKRRAGEAVFGTFGMEEYDPVSLLEVSALFM